MEKDVALVPILGVRGWAGRLEFDQGSDVSSILVSGHFLLRQPLVT